MSNYNEGFAAGQIAGATSFVQGQIIGKAWVGNDTYENAYEQERADHESARHAYGNANKHWRAIADGLVANNKVLQQNIAALKKTVEKDNEILWDWAVTAKKKSATLVGENAAAAMSAIGTLMRAQGWEDYAALDAAMDRIMAGQGGAQIRRLIVESPGSRKFYTTPTHIVDDWEAYFLAEGDRGADEMMDYLKEELRTPRFTPT